MKRLASVGTKICVLAVALMLASCGGGGSPESEPEPIPKLVGVVVAGYEVVNNTTGDSILTNPLEISIQALQARTFPSANLYGALDKDGFRWLLAGICQNNTCYHEASWSGIGRAWDLSLSGNVGAFLRDQTDKDRNIAMEFDTTKLIAGASIRLTLSMTDNGDSYIQTINFVE